MSYQFHATCECGYRSDVLGHDTCLCPECRDLVDVPRIPFRYALSPCPKCNCAMFEDDTLLEILGTGWLVTEKPSALTCPKCENAKVTFHFDAHVYRIFGTEFPDVGAQIDGHLKRRGEIDIPWFPLDGATVKHDVPEDLAIGQRITVRVLSITTAVPTDRVKSMFYEKVVTHLQVEYLNPLAKNRRSF